MTRASNTWVIASTWRRATDLDAILRSDEWDAVHLVTPVTMHAAHTLAVLEAGKHCACTIPMALEIEDLRRIITTQRRVGKNYMMMETAVYTRAFRYVKELYKQGAFGRLTFLRGRTFRTWRGGGLLARLPPHKHITHALAPLLALTGTRATKVHCFGSGQLREELQRPYNNPFPWRRPFSG
jgi:predicted dehydrogenase